MSLPEPAATVSPAPERVRPQRALLSVSDKGGLLELAKALRSCNVEILSTGGTAEALKKESIQITDVGVYTGFPEMMDGRVKTLHPKIHGGILQSRNNSQHRFQATEHNIPPIDIVVVNLYPFSAAVEKGAGAAACIENIDIGGPALIRAAAKNHDFVTVLTSPAQYEELMDELKKQDGEVSRSFRRRCAGEAFALTARYDAAVAAWFAGKEAASAVPARLNLSYALKQTLRYGENPHQTGAIYLSDGARNCAATAEQMQGKELSYNNYNDADAAFELACDFDKPTVAIVKHANPCGVASDSNTIGAYKKALACDPVSAFGGVIALNGRLDGPTAAAISDIFTEVIIAPDADEEAKRILAGKKNLRLLLTGGLPEKLRAAQQVKNISGGLLAQSRDNAVISIKDWKVMTRRAPTPIEASDLVFAARVAKHVKSNAIVYAKGEATVGIGAGQMSRVDSVRIAAWKASEAAQAAGLKESLTIGSVVASDAFFPFADGLLTAVKAGATAVIQPGGSVRDNEVIAAANEAGIAMVFTGVRNFRH